jgi:hypothetical protein
LPSINQINLNIAKLADGKTVRFLNINDRLGDKKWSAGRGCDGGQTCT